jgi:hypothetical protein
MNTQGGPAVGAPPADPAGRMVSGPAPVNRPASGRVGARVEGGKP